LSRLGTRLSPKRNTPKRAPPTAPPGTQPAPTAPTLYLSSTILRKASRSTTEEEDSEYFSNYLWLFRSRMPLLRRQDLLWRTVFLLGGKVGIRASDHE
jgi:hypothetical protein